MRIYTMAQLIFKWTVKCVADHRIKFPITVLVMFSSSDQLANVLVH